ncbi:hypothetical protein C1H46_002546 [Malus baccata]|uniref:Uncharacterized protein n=1 Tax=Malus baccata TaxID=106549 RepID=A0A540NLJ6_MALBA|nr:hypothetical protein C1H46_002546 [Malus baccata]
MERTCCAEQLRDKGGESTAERQRCAPGGTASGDDDAAAVVQRLQPVEEVGVMAGSVDCGGQHCGFCGDHVRERLPQELRHLHWSVPRPPLLSALQGKPR